MLDQTSTATALVGARRARTALPGFPGEPPGNVGAAYRIQDIAIGLQAQPIAGWKVGLIPPAWRAAAGAERLIGPIFAELVWEDEPGAEIALLVIPGGTACVEAEFIVRLGRDVAPAAGEWSIERAISCVAEVRLGVELAGSRP